MFIAGDFGCTGHAVSLEVRLFELLVCWKAYREFQRELLQDCEGPGETSALAWKPSIHSKGAAKNLFKKFCSLNSAHTELKFSKEVMENGHSQSMVC